MEAEIEAVKTEVGTYHIHEFANIFQIQDERVKLDLYNSLEGRETNPEDVVARIQTLQRRHPREPFFPHFLIDFYDESDDDRYEAELKAAFAKFPEHPGIRYTYTSTFCAELEPEELRRLIGPDGDLHARHPDWRYFDESTVVNFLASHVYAELATNNRAQAMKYATSICPLDPQLCRVAKKSVSSYSPMRRFFSILKFIAVVFVVLGIIAWILYGIYRLVVWIF